MEVLQHINKSYFNGKFQEGKEKQVVNNPANNEILGEITHITFNQVSLAIECSAKAFEEIKELSFEIKSKLLVLWGDKIEANRAELARIITLEQGKTLKESQAEIDYALSYIRYFAALSVDYNKGYSLPASKLFSQRQVLHQPIGVAAAITPWNFPIAMYIRKFAAAFMAGCSMIVKPAQLTPFSASYTLKLWLECNPPLNSLQMLHGEATMVSDCIANSFVVRKISFTGSTAVGMLLARSSAKTLKRVSLELGGNAPLIIFEDADLDIAAEMIINGKFRNNGQSCIAINRVLVDKKIKFSLINKILPRIAALKVGDGLDTQNDLGALISQQAVTRIHNLVLDAQNNGCKILCGGLPYQGKGAFYQPTIIDNCNSGMAIFIQEIFGPVVTITEFSNEEESLTLANATQYGLAAYICGTNHERNQKVAQQLQFGMIGVNDARISDASIPFGGIKASGYGREGGEEGLFEYLQTKYIGTR